MSFAVINSLGCLGIDAYGVKVEADTDENLPGFDVVGLPDASVKESRDRVRAAVHNCGFEFPPSRVTINLAPADIRKEGPMYDLPIFMAVLRVTRQLEYVPEGSSFIGELSLSGEVRPVKGVLAMAIEARDLGYKSLFIPRANAAKGGGNCRSYHRQEGAVSRRAGRFSGKGVQRGAAGFFRRAGTGVPQARTRGCRGGRP